MTPPPLAGTAEAGVPDTEVVEEVRVIEHSYDGIREFDNPLPGWWTTMFWGAIVFAAGYFVYFHVLGWASTPAQTYEAALASYDERKDQRERAEMRDISEEMFARNAQNPATVAKGKEIFATRCASCHAPEGQGLIGPNLTDGYQLHGTTRMDIFKTVRGGVAGTAMLAWGEQMPPADIVSVATFVTTLRGTNVAGKEAQGAPVEPFQ